MTSSWRSVGNFDGASRLVSVEIAARGSRRHHGGQTARMNEENTQT